MKDTELISSLDEKASAFFSHQNPSVIEWFG